MLGRAGGKTVAVGYDGRVSSPMLEEALVRGITDAGLDAVRIGMGPTPMLYYAEAVMDDVDGGIEITGSHNPANYNGFKMVFQGRPFFGNDIQELGRIAAAGDWPMGKARQLACRHHRPVCCTYCASRTPHSIPHRVGCRKRCGGTGH